MDSPPPNILPAETLALLAQLVWRFTVTDPSGLRLGVLSDGQHDLHLASTASGWRVFDTLPPGLGPVLLCEKTFDVMRGPPSEHRIHTYWTGTHWTARALPA